MLEGIILMKK